MKINIKDSVLDFGGILLMHTLVQRQKKSAERQLKKAIVQNAHIQVMVLNDQLQSLAKIEEFINELTRQEWQQTVGQPG